MKLKYVFETVEMDDQIVAVPIANGDNGFIGVIKMNETAAFIFNCLSEDTTEEAIVAQLLKEYDAQPEELANYVHSYIEQLREKDILE